MTGMLLELFSNCFYEKKRLLSGSSDTIASSVFKETFFSFRTAGGQGIGTKKDIEFGRKELQGVWLGKANIFNILATV